MKPRFTIDGATFSTWSEFTRVFSRTVLDGKHVWEGSLDAFNDILRGGFGSPDGGFVLIWRNHQVSRANLSEVVADGATRFESAVAILRDHGPGGAEPEDGVELILE